MRYFHGLLKYVMQPELFTLETERLILKGITPEAYKIIMDNSGNEEVIRFWGLQTDAELQAELRRYKGGMTCYYHSFMRFVLEEKATGNVIGQCGYHKWYKDHSRAEIGYNMSIEELKNKGYMREAIAPIIEYGFTTMKLNRVEAFIHPENEPSVKLVQRLGFTYEGLMREHYCSADVIEDSACYSLLSREFYKLKESV